MTAECDPLAPLSAASSTDDSHQDVLIHPLSDSVLSLPPQEPSRPIHAGLEYEGQRTSPEKAYEKDSVEVSSSSSSTTRRSVILSFVGMVVFGTLNVVLAKLQAIPM